MAKMDWTFPGGFILGAGLMYLLNPKRIGPRSSIQDKAACITGALGVAALAYGTKLIARHGRRDASTATAFDTDVPNYAQLR